MSFSKQLMPIEQFQVVPILLMDTVVYPHTLIPKEIKNTEQIKLLERVATDTEKNKYVLLIAQEKNTIPFSATNHLYEIGTLANVLQLIKSSSETSQHTIEPGNTASSQETAQVVLEGIQRSRIMKIFEEKGEMYAQIVPFPTQIPKDEKTQETIKALSQNILEQFKQYIQIHSRKIPLEIINILADLEDPDRLSDMVAMHITFPLTNKQDLLAFKQELLSIDYLEKRLNRLSIFLEEALELLSIQKKVRERVRSQMEKNHREYYINEHIKAMQQELGNSQGTNTEYDVLAKSIKEAKMPKLVHEKAMTEFNKLKNMSSLTAEATVIRNYLDVLTRVPWYRKTKIQYRIESVEEHLNQKHYGLKEIKKRIIEFIAVQKRVPKSKSPILCFVGPPGVGKTSLGESIATAIGRKHERISLGGVSDEAEIRGHRRTYIGSMPGQFIQKLTRTGVTNPVLILDEIDKIGSRTSQGNPSSALLEILDPEQNRKFNDHYLEVDYDLSEILFIATANEVNHISEALLDRMEVIRLSSYMQEEKENIASTHLLPKQKKQHALNDTELHITEDAITDIIRYYTSEPGVRHLEREIAKLCRKVVIRLEKEKLNTLPIMIESKDLEQYLGTKRFRHEEADHTDQIGLVNGLAWTAVRGELLKIESLLIPGKNKITHTGQLGEVMQESIKTALTVVKSRLIQFQFSSSVYEHSDIHVHLPEGATPKDGPSAGIGICCALLSSIVKQPVRGDIAMTGEITLLGKVLPIGGLKEKLLAAYQSRIKCVIIPKENERDLSEIPQNVLDSLTIHTVRWIDEVFQLAFRAPLSPMEKTTESTSFIGNK